MSRNTILKSPNKSQLKRNRLLENIKNHPIFYLMALPILVYYLVFHYLPMLGVITAFQDYRPALGFFKSKWIGFDQFKRFFSSMHFNRVVRNTFLISFLDLIFGFPAPIVFALLLNEIRSSKFQKLTQTVTYLPHFISLVVIAGLIRIFTSSSSITAQLVSAINGAPPINLLAKAEYFRQVYIISGIWQGFGWGSIIYFAALTNVDPELHEAASLDGAGRFGRVIHITLPAILPTVVTMLILRMGQLLSVGHEKIILLYSPITYETADVIASYTYRAGLTSMDYSYGTAIGLFNSMINLFFIIAANTISRKLTDESLW